MKQEHTLVLIIGLLILAYVLDAIVQPLGVKLTTPYHYLDPKIISSYAFTTTSIVIKSVALFILPLWLFSFFSFKKFTKGVFLLVLSGLMQLYSLQDVVTGTNLVPVEWAISLTLAGVILLIPTILYIVAGGAEKVHKTLLDEPEYEDDPGTPQKDFWKKD